jgi:hypothetical protein
MVATVAAVVVDEDAEDAATVEEDEPLDEPPR